MKINCEWFHNKFDPSCKNCRQIFCKDCKDFMVSFKMFLKNTDKISVFKIFCIRLFKY